jgi:hypothetical protein
MSPDPSLSFELIFMTIGLLIPLVFYSILISMGIKRILALVATIVFMLNPTLVLYENLLYYTYFEAFLILLSIFFILRWVIDKKLYNLLLFWISILCLGMIRSLFQPVFFIAASLILALYLRYGFNEKKLAWNFFLSSFAAILPMFLLCLKNLILFGFFGTSSWAGMSLWIKTNGYSQEELKGFHAKGVISSIAIRAEFMPFKPINNFYSEDNNLKNIPCHHSSDCDELKTNGKPNFNHIGYVYVSKQLWKDSMSLIFLNPSLFVLYTAGSYCITLWHSSDSVHALFENNMSVVENLENIYRFLNFGFMGVVNKYSNKGQWARTIVITAFILFIYAGASVNIFRKNNFISPGVKFVCLFCILIHSYAIIVSSVIEFGENNRFRFPVDPAFLILIAGNIVMRMKREKSIITNGEAITVPHTMRGR